MKRWNVAVVAAAMCSSFAALEAPARLVAVYGADADTLSCTNDFGSVTADGMLSPSF